MHATLDAAITAAHAHKDRTNEHHVVVRTAHGNAFTVVSASDYEAAAATMRELKNTTMALPTIAYSTAEPYA
jgi:PHD/YefM family antitoxin component YafN of YafNO toxin-antitoxin module